MGKRSHETDISDEETWDTNNKYNKRARRHKKPKKNHEKTLIRIQSKNMRKCGKKFKNERGRKCHQRFKPTCNEEGFKIKKN